MSTPDKKDLIAGFWRDLRDLRTGMLGLAGDNDGHAQPMTAHFDDEGQLYFYAHADSPLAHAAQAPHPAAFHYASRDHELYACVRGDLRLETDKAVRARFWSDEVSRWFPGGQDDPDLALLRLDLSDADIWRPSHGASPGVFNFGVQPPKDERAGVNL